MHVAFGEDIRSVILGTEPVIPPRSNRTVQYAYDKAIYRERNVIERMFCRLKDWRRIATVSVRPDRT